MICGIGIDIIEVARIQAQVDRDHGFRERIYTAGEIGYCEGKKNRGQHYAARFAAKEAFMKALGTGWRLGVRFVDIEVYRDEMGRPLLRVAGKAAELAQQAGIRQTHVSLTHTRETASAIVVVEN